MPLNGDCPLMEASPSYQPQNMSAGPALTSYRHISYMPYVQMARGARGRERLGPGIQFLLADRSLPPPPRLHNAKHFSGSGQGSYRNTTGTISDLHGPPGGSFMHICNDPQIGTVENAASVPICSSQPN